MSVTNLSKAVEAIVGWIDERVAEAGASATVSGLSGGADSALVAILCSKAKVPWVGVKMPCHSSGSSRERADELAKKFNLTVYEVDLARAHESIESQAIAQINLERAARGLDPIKADNGSSGALRSCLRAPTLDFVSKLYKGIIVGTGNRDEDKMTRYFQKRGDGCVDISPIAELHKSEVYELLRFLDCPKSIIEATPTADLWGPDSGQEDEKELGLTYKEVEWGIREINDKTTYDPLEYEANYTPEQYQTLCRLDQMERLSRHKASPPPVFDIRSIPGLVS